MYKSGGKKEPPFALGKEQKAVAIAKIKDYAAENFDVELGNLQTEMFLDFLTEKLGPAYYNKGVTDAMAFMNEKVEDLYLLMQDEEG